MSRHARLSVTVVAGMLAGCGPTRERDEVVPIDKLPPAALKAAREKLPGVRFDGAWKERGAAQPAYEIRGRNQEGKVRDVKVTASGEILEVD